MSEREERLQAALDAGLAVMAELEATYPSGRVWADKYRRAIDEAMKGAGDV